MCHSDKIQFCKNTSIAYVTSIALRFHNSVKPYQESPWLGISILIYMQFICTLYAKKNLSEFMKIHENVLNIYADYVQKMYRIWNVYAGYMQVICRW